MCLTDRRASRARAAMRSGVRAVRPELRRSGCMCVARVRRPSRTDGLRAAAHCVPAAGVLGEALAAKRARAKRGIVARAVG